MAGPYDGLNVWDTNQWGNPVALAPNDQMSPHGVAAAQGPGQSLPFFNSALDQLGINSDISRWGANYFDNFLNSRSIPALADILGNYSSLDNMGSNTASTIRDLIAGSMQPGNNVFQQIYQALANPSSGLAQLLSTMDTTQQMSFLSDALKGAIGLSTGDRYAQSAMNNSIENKLRDFESMFIGTPQSDNARFLDSLMQSGLLQQLAGQG